MREEPNFGIDSSKKRTLKEARPVVLEVWSESVSFATDRARPFDGFQANSLSR